MGSMIYNNSKYNQDWNVKALSKLGEFSRGKSKHRPRNDKQLFTDGVYPLVQTGEISSANLFIRSHNAAYNEIGLKQSKLWKKNTLCITIAANIAETALLGYPMCFPDSIVGFNAYSDESSEIFMHYVFTFIKKAIQNSASGSIQDNININYLTSLKFRIPPKYYQDKIANVLSALDAKIELNNRINAELEAMAKTLYDYWFVQFEFPNIDGKPYKSSGGKMVWNDELKREIPEGWEVKRVVEILAKESAKTKTPSSEFKKEGNIPVIDQSTDFIAGYTDDENSKIFGKEIPRIVFGDHTRILKLINFDFARGADGTQVLLSNNPRIPQHLFYHSLLKIDLSNYGYARHFKFLKDRLIIEPNLSSANQFEEKAISFYSMIRDNIFENQHLSSLRDWLLPMLMNGQVRVNEQLGVKYEQFAQRDEGTSGLMAAEEIIKYKNK